jgi:hypothetical protein
MLNSGCLPLSRWPRADRSVRDREPGADRALGGPGPSSRAASLLASSGAPSESFLSPRGILFAADMSGGLPNKQSLVSPLRSSGRQCSRWLVRQLTQTVATTAMQAIVGRRGSARVVDRTGE